MHCLVNTVITTTDRLRIKLLQTPLEQIHALSLFRVLAHLLDTLTENFTHWFRLPWRLHRILTHILNDCPQVQHWPPVNVPQIPHQHVRFVTSDKRIIPRKTSIPLALPIALLERQPFLKASQEMRKSVATVRTLRFTPRTCITHLRRIQPMLVVPVPFIDKRSNELSNRSQINLCPRRSRGLINKHTLEQTTKAHGVRRLRHVWTKIT